MRRPKKEILELHEAGLTVPEIIKKLGCCKASVYYHINAKYRENNKERNRKYYYESKQRPLLMKYSNFAYDKTRTRRKPKPQSNKRLLMMKIRRFTDMKPTFTIEDLEKKLGPNPVCYITGEPIDLHKPRTYHLDHMIPRSRGGDNSLDNLGICTGEANFAKRAMTPDELYNLCKKILTHQGYTLIPPE